MPVLSFLIYQLASIYRTKKKFSIYRKYVHNFSQNDFHLLTNYIHGKIVIVPIIGMTLFRHQYNAVMQPVKRSLKQLFCYNNVIFSQPFPLNCGSLACLIDKIM